MQMELLNVSAKDKGTGKEQTIRIESGNSLSEEEINKMKMEQKKTLKKMQKKWKKLIS